MRTQEMAHPGLRMKTPLILNGNKKGYMRNKKKSELKLIGIVCLDIFLLNLCLVASIHFFRPIGEIFVQHPTTAISFFLLANIIGAIVAAYTSIYQVFEGVRIQLNIRDLFWTTLVFFGVLSMIYYPFFFQVFRIHFLLPAFVAFFLLSTILHLAIRYYGKDRSRYIAYAVVGGSPNGLRHLGRVMAYAYGPNAFCLGRFSDNDLPGTATLGSYSEVQSYLERHNNVTKLLYFDSPLNTDEVLEINRLCRSKFIDFEVIPKEIEYFEQGTHVEQLAMLPILRRKREPLNLLKNRLLKRGFDIVFSSFVILFIFPWLLPIIAILIKLESRGPVFFKQARTGYWNKPFMCYKFRSMTVNREANEKQAVKGDARFTRIGKILRKTNLDEVPQFINVLKGDMSVVGPRPHMLKHTEIYSEMIDRFMVRHEVKPGITGWAQVNGWRGPTDELYKMDKRVEFDVHYIENWSFWFDLTCIFLTVANVFKGEENAF